MQLFFIINDIPLDCFRVWERVPSTFESDSQKSSEPSECLLINSKCIAEAILHKNSMALKTLIAKMKRTKKNKKTQFKVKANGEI